MSKLNWWHTILLFVVAVSAAWPMAAHAQTIQTLASFNGTKGSGPASPLVQGLDGNFYGTTQNGGANGGGTVFEITPTGYLTTLHSFCSQPGCTDGAVIFAGLVQATDGKFYGTTKNGDAKGDGTVYKITPAGHLTTIHSFFGPNGADPYAGLIQATDGNLYGATNAGGTEGAGTIFETALGGKTTTLYSFCSQLACSDGVGPLGGLIQATNGNFYGTTSRGGANNDGTVFSLSTGLGPFVETLSTSRELGAAVIILGNNLTGASSVTFNGTPATFTVVSDTEITTTVPIGATTGKVEVTTPSGTLTSNVDFCPI